MATIHILSDHLVSQIAAGEVVERPASVVKELIENALDAGATELKIELEAGGKRRIVVSDDGCGLERDDALLAFDRHATSKIASFEDLEQVGTLGFRGEALASIAAVARVELLTATATDTSSGEGHRVRIEGGRVKVAEPAARAQGTTLEVASLFFNVPARRKFLKTPQTEMRKCVEVVQGYALACPAVRFTLVHDGRTLLDALPAGDDAEGLRQRIGQIFGQTLADHLVPIAAEGAPRGPAGVEIGGFVGDPETTRGRRLFVYVNRRLIRDRAVLATFYRAVREEWKREDYPALFLFLELDPAEVDVNVHPQKAEVRFRDPQLTFRLSQVLRRALGEARGEEAAPLREVTGTSPWGGSPAGAAPADRPYGTPAGGPSLAWQGLGQKQRPTADSDEGAWEVHEPATGGYTAGEAGEPGQRLATPSYAPVQRSTVPLSGRSGEQRPFRLVGQYKGTLILLEGSDGLYLVDQHVAHERILYERLRRTLKRESTPSQALLTPILLDLSKAEALRLAELAPQLAEGGFEVAEMSGDTVAMVRVPAVLSAEQGERLLMNLAQERAGETADDLDQRLLDALAADLSCRNAVKMHHPLHPDEMEALVAELFAAEQPYACPHGRPIVLKMTDGDLERRFGRR